jgi:protein gp37
MGSGRDDGELAIDDNRTRLVTMNDLRRDLFALIDQTPWLTWLLLTKRPGNINRMWRPLPHNGRDPSDPLVARRDNVWLLTSVSEQASADKNIPELLKCRDLCYKLGVSAEPLLGPVDFTNIGTYDGRPLSCLSNHPCVDDEPSLHPGVTWVIVGGESGPHARPCDVAWIRSIRDQCAAASVACFIKQLGANVIDSALTGQRAPAISGGWPAGTRFATVLDDERYLVPGHAKLRDPKGGDISEWPESLRVREFPQTTTRPRGEGIGNQR